MSALSLVFAAALSCAPAGHPIVTEVYYDAPGDDTGQEFVELWNDSDSTRALTGVRLEAGDGAGPGRWTLRWTGGAGDSVKPHARFVIGGASVIPRPDVVLSLELQNGPDGLRFVWPDGAAEVVGWGALEFPEYSCGTPAPDVPGGQSLARIPDRANTGSNAGDFHPSQPSPGATAGAFTETGAASRSLVTSSDASAVPHAAMPAFASASWSVAVPPGVGCSGTSVV